MLRRLGPSTSAEHVGHPRRDWNYARNTFGDEEAFAGICRELNEFIVARDIEPLFDAVLIDEAQDLPSEFFRLVYSLTKAPKRIVFAYDELQSLSETSMPVAEELFGPDESGRPLVSFENVSGEARRDIVLPVCYRNSPWALTIAHALGFGVYRKPSGLVQHFDGTQLWTDIGYSVRSGSLAPGQRVRLRRSPRSTPSYFSELLTPEDAVLVHAFDTEGEQDIWLANAIAQNLSVDELEPDDILIVIPNTYTAKSRSLKISRQLSSHGIDSHLAGVGSSVDEVFVAGSIAMAHIHRAKGNEAPIIYIPDAQYGVADRSPVARRNALFTAISRSRAWVRITGTGDLMSRLVQEVEDVRANDYSLEFVIPTDEDLQQMRRIHRDRADSKPDASDRAARTLDELVELVESGDLELADLAPRLRRKLIRLLKDNELDLDRE